MRKAVCLFIFFSAILAFPLGERASAAEILISEAVGQAGSHIVTSREVQLAFVVDWALEKRSGLPPPALYKTTHFDNELVEVLKDWVVYLEIKGFAGSSSSPEDLAALTTSTRALIKKVPFYNSLEFSDRELSEVIHRKLKVKKFIHFKRLSAAAPVSESDALKYFQRNQTKFGNGTFAEYKDSIRQALSRRLVDRRLQDWFEILIRKYQAHSFIQDF